MVSHYSSLIYSAAPKYLSNGLIEQEMNTVRPAVLYLNNSGFHLGGPLAISQEQERRDIAIMKCKFLETSSDGSVFGVLPDKLTQSASPQKQRRPYKNVFLSLSQPGPHCITVESIVFPGQQAY